MGKPEGLDEFASAELCPDCGTALEPIKLIDHAHGGGHAEIQYAPDDARRGFWLGQFPIAGIVRAKMCPSCGRITLRGERQPAS